jgi:hypothetical protein
MIVGDGWYQMCYSILIQIHCLGNGISYMIKNSFEIIFSEGESRYTKIQRIS